MSRSKFNLPVNKPCLIVPDKFNLNKYFHVVSVEKEESGLRLLVSVPERFFILEQDIQLENGTERTFLFQRKPKEKPIYEFLRIIERLRHYAETNNFDYFSYLPDGDDRRHIVIDHLRRKTYLKVSPKLFHVS